MSLTKDSAEIKSTWQIYAESISSKNNMFITISCDPRKIFTHKKVSNNFHLHTPQYQYEIIIKKLNKVIESMIKEGMKFDKYIMFPEYNKQGNIHVHGIISHSTGDYEYYPITLRKHLISYYGNAHSVKCEEVKKLDECMAYCSKDILKMKPLTAIIKERQKVYFD